MNVLKVIGCSMALCVLPLSGQTGGGTELFRDMKAPQHERIMDQLADAGVVGEEEGTKPRKVLMSMEQFENMMEEGY